MVILVTGGTGTLGRELVPRLRSRDAAVEVLSRRQHPGFRTGDLSRGDGLDAALEGIDTVVHLAAGKDQAGETRGLVDAMKRHGVQRLVFISIVGIDQIPFPYYVDKLAAERTVLDSGLGVSVLRTTPFHSFAAAPFLGQRLSPVLFAPRLKIQPIDVREVAVRLADLAQGVPRGRVADVGGPSILAGHELAREVSRRFGWSKPIVDFSLPGGTWASFGAGYHLVPHHRSGGRTFAAYLASL
ncbi:NAD(P)H-binding protein [Conyzicola nivalis]|uniref:Nucleotide-diphosphate-sugar epimerase n=1 Tax=Conyzicola nivalis TaxID=1477021 RepID=A0A916WGR6_9MICO|nr:NAD(P)H-binding protein [Conyzicola nivalis]GGA97918.1 nucleotide-diphosphate-sugar epimerase [Conyzicola nivalis]